MSDIKTAFPFQEQQDMVVNFVKATTAFTSGTTKNTDTGFTECKAGTLLTTTVASTTAVYLITSVASDGKLTAVTLK